jgi:hypothetical protein
MIKMIWAYRVDPRNLLDKVEHNFYWTNKISEADICFFYVDSVGEYINQVKEAKKLGVPTVWIENNRVAAAVYAPPVNKELICDYAFIWGAHSKSILKGIIQDDRIYITGCPLIEDLPPKVEHAGLNIVYAPNHWIPDIQEIYDVLDELVKKDYSLTIKTIHMNDTARIQKYVGGKIKIISTNPGTPEHLSRIFKLLEETDIVVTLQEEQTFCFICHAMGIPVIRVKHWKDKKITFMGKEDSTVYTAELMEKRLSKATYDCSLSKIHDMIENISDELRLTGTYLKTVLAQFDAEYTGGRGEYIFSSRFMKYVRYIVR